VSQGLLNERNLILDEELSEFVLQKCHQLSERIFTRGQELPTLGPKHVYYLVSQRPLVICHDNELVLSLGDLNDALIDVSIDDDGLPPDDLPLRFDQLWA